MAKTLHSGQKIWLAIVTGALMGFFLWHYLIAEIFGYLAIWRFPDHWGAVTRMVVPMALFFVATVVTCWALVMCFGRASVAGIWASLVSYTLGAIGVLVTMSHGVTDILVSALLVCAAAAAALIGVRFARGRNEFGKGSGGLRSSEGTTQVRHRWTIVIATLIVPAILAWRWVWLLWGKVVTGWGEYSAPFGWLDPAMLLLWALLCALGVVLGCLVVVLARPTRPLVVGTASGLLLGFALLLAAKDYFTADATISAYVWTYGLYLMAPVGSLAGAHIAIFLQRRRGAGVRLAREPARR